MTVNVSAVVLSHDQPVSLTRVLNQLSKQTISPSRILVVDSSKTEAAASQGFETIKLNHKTSFAVAIEAAVKHLATDGYIWILHDDSAPDADALEKLLKEIELSPSLAVVGPKQVDWDDPKLIKQMGLTLTRGGKLFNRVRGEYDQGQHDHLEDVMAVGTAGALVNLDKYKQLGGFDPKAPPLAADVDFSIRARLSGGRVAIAPASKIAHQMLSMNGQRSRSWLGGSPAKAIRHAEFYLALSYASFLVFVFGWLLLIPFAMLNSLALLVRKRAGSIPVELSAAVTTFMQLGRILSSRSRIRRTSSAKLGSLATLRATRQELKSSNQRAKDQEVSTQLLAAHARGDNDEITQNPNSGFLSSGAIWFALGLVALNVLWVPTNFAVSGAGVIPLSSNWLDIFTQAGSMNQSLGLGFVGAADPFSWVLAILSAPLFFQPSLAITVVLFLSTAISFTGMFYLSGRITRSNPLRITSALAYALWPALTVSITDTRIAQVIAITVLPYLAHSIAKVANLGLANPGSFVSTWSQVGVSGILLALISASSPVLGLTLIVLIVGLAIARPSKLMALLFTTGLTIAWFIPLVLERLGTVSPLAILMSPGPGSASGLEANWTLPFFGFGFDSLAFGLFITAPLVVLALIALLTPGAKAALGLWIVALTALPVAFVGSGVEFNFGQITSVNLELSSLLALYGLAVIAAFAQLSAASKALRSIAISLVAVLGIAPAAFAMATNPPAVSYSDGRSVPSIIQADADAGMLVRTLKLGAGEDSVSAELVEGAGVKLEQLSSAFQIANSGLSDENPQYQVLGQLVANLVSANGADVLTPLEEIGISYILVSPADRDLQMALDSTRGLESIGETDFGQLWKVQSVTSVPKVSELDLAPSKILSLGALVLYVLLALPTSSIRKRNGKESAIFVDAEENN
jgi:GT2 family glycosyltransferase